MSRVTSPLDILERHTSRNKAARIIEELDAHGYGIWLSNPALPAESPQEPSGANRQEPA